MAILYDQIARLTDEIQVCIIGLACELQQVPDPMQKNDIFGEHIHIPIPTMAERITIIKDLLDTISLEQISGATENLQEYYAKEIALRTSGYVARDLKKLCRRAVLKSLRKSDIAESLLQLSLNETTRSFSEVQWKDFEYALSRQRPSQQMQVESDLPKRSWTALGGYEAVKRRIRQATLLPLLQPEIFSKLGIKAPSGLLLYGPSGCGKTAFVQALASESMLNVISIKGPEIFSKYLGETELKIRNLFATAKRIAPCIMFIDEMDAISTRRGWNSGDSSGGVNERVLSTLLNEMDGVEGRQGVIVIGCTNRPDQIDDAILRPGRLDQLVYLGLPTQEDRRAIVDVLIKKTAVAADVNADDLSERMEYCTGADIENLFREAGTIALRKDINAQSIGMDQVDQVIESICDKARHRVLEEGSLEIYEQFHKDHSI
ncbi:AAA-domain-containing protein [Lichtheimia hyalospora FSU 10163]|nr:AAA-domain-containing protein [Lichtheimia hyalospora FSU 10163]